MTRGMNSLSTFSWPILPGRDDQRIHQKKEEEEENPFNLILIRFHTLPSLWREAGKASCLLSFSLFFSLKIPLQDLATTTTTTSMANAFFLSRHLFSNSSSSTSDGVERIWKGHGFSIDNSPLVPNFYSALHFT